MHVFQPACLLSSEWQSPWASESLLHSQLMVEKSKPDKSNQTIVALPAVGLPHSQSEFLCSCICHPVGGNHWTSFFMLFLERKISCFAVYLNRGTVHSKIEVCPRTCQAVDPSKLFRCEMPSFGDISCRDVCHLNTLNWMTLSRLLKIIHRPCCEQFNVRTIFLSIELQPASSPCRRMSASTHGRECG